MKRLKTIAVVLAMAVLCFASIAMANELSFYDSVNEWIVTAYSKENVGADSTYSVYLNIRDKEGGAVLPELILLTRTEENVRQDPDPANGDYLICNCAISGEISLAYNSAAGLSDIFVMDHHIDAAEQEFVQVHNHIKLSGFDVQDPANISVSGSGAFGTVNVGSTVTHFIQVTNTGEANLVLGTLDVSGTGFTRNGGTCSNGQTLVEDASCTIGVQFAPTAATPPYTGALTIPSNDADYASAPLVVALSGAGYQQTGTPDLIISNVTHGSNTVNGGTITMTVYVKNNGNGTAGPFVVRGTKGTTTEMYSWNVPALAPGQEISERHSYQVTCSTHATYYLYHTADSSLQVTESSETNNRRITSVSCSR